MIKGSQGHARLHRVSQAVAVALAVCASALFIFEKWSISRFGSSDERGYYVQVLRELVVLAGSCRWRGISGWRVALEMGLGAIRARHVTALARTSQSAASTHAAPSTGRQRIGGERAAGEVSLQEIMQTHRLHAT